MTCIVGVKARGLTWMGGDSCFSDGYHLSIRPEEKVFFRGKFLIGICGSPRAGNLLRYTFEPPAPETDSLSEYMAKQFITAMRECFNANGYAQKENEVESISSAFMVGIVGRLFEIDSDYQIVEVPEYGAIGSGAQPALGALYATRHLGPVKRLTIALEAAEQFNIGVRGPFHILRSAK